MDIVIKKSNAVKALQNLQSIVQPRAAMPILANVLMDFTDKLKFTVNNLELSATSSISAEGDQVGSITVGAKTFCGIIREMPEQEIKIRTTPTQMIITSGKSRFTLATLPADQFPTIGKVNSDDSPMVITTSQLSAMLEKTNIAMSSDETRAVLCGICLMSGESGLRMVATDTHRMAMTIDESSVYEQESSIIIPRKTVSELIKILKTESGNVAVLVGSESKSINFTFESGLSLSSSLIVGRFPDYKRVIPESGSAKFSAKIGHESLLRTVKRVSSLSPENSFGVRLTFSHESLVVFGKSDSDESVETVECEFIGDDGFSVGFNAGYLIQILNVMTGKQVSFLFKDDETPALVSDETDKNSLFVLMPMRL